MVPPVLIPQSALRKIFTFLSSRRLAVFLTLALGVVALVGALVPQNRPPEYYEAHYKEWAYNVLNTIGLTDVFKSWYFIGILIFIAVSLAVCTGRRVSAAFAAFKVRPPRLPFDEGTFCQTEIGPETAFKPVIAALRRLPFDSFEGEGIFYGRRGRRALIGALLIHVGLLSALLGVLLGVFGRRDEIFVFEGQRLALPRTYGEGFEIKADAVDVAADANTGKVLSYQTKINLLRNGDEVAAGELELNKPLRYHGLAIYQSDKASADAKGLILEELVLKKGAAADDYGGAKFSWEVGTESGDVTMVPGETGALGTTGLTLRYVEYFERFYASEAGVGDDGADYNPVAFVEIENVEGEKAKGVLFKLYPERSFIRADVPDFTAKSVRVDYSGDDGPWRAARREHILASGSYVAVAGETMRVVMAGGEGSDLSQRALEGVIERRGGAEERIKFPFGAGVTVRTDDGDRIFRFLGSRTAPVTALTVARERGLAFFYAACLLFSAGVVAAALLRYDELVAYVRGGRVYLAARSSKGAGVLRPAFDAWVAGVKENV
ncbi:MAG TPA: cytochrome c biogenesis protein ResB [bacterium]|nr:cytochrome c biogenesis protein ResB [bacterium]